MNKNEKTIHPFVVEINKIRLKNCFNPYFDSCPIHDHSESPFTRAEMISDILYKAERTNIDAIWVGRDLGYRGGRRTGLALTDDIHIARHTGRWNIAAKKPTLGKVVSERTASVIWKKLDCIQENVFLWNVFPFHPHEKNNPLSNRQHNAEERKVGESILESLIEILSPSKLIAIGNDADVSCRKLAKKNMRVEKVRHPSYGGQNQFSMQISELYP